MGILGQLVHIPTAEQWPLLKPLMLLMLLLFLPFAGLMLVSGVLSLAYRLRGTEEDDAVARELIDIGTRNPASWFVFGLLPLVTLFFLLGQYLFGTGVPIGAWIMRITGLVAIGFGLIYLYRRTLALPLGGVGVLILAGGLYHFNATLTLLSEPERWPFVKLPLPFLYSIQPLVHFGIFLAGAVAFTGACLLVTLFAWPDRQAVVGDRKRQQMGALGKGMLLAGLLPVPLLLVWDVYTAPGFSLSPEVFRMTGWMIGVALLLALLVFNMIARSHTRFAWPAFVLSLAFFGLFAGKQQTQASVGGEEHEQGMVAQLDRTRQKVVAAREELYATSAQLPPDAGEQIFNQRCSACHAFDHKVVGPPYNDVLPRFVGDLNGLADFIYNPVKVDPNYPTMPNQGLRRAEARAVAQYILDRFQSGGGGGGEEEGGGGGAPPNGAGSASRQGGRGR